MTCHPSAFPLAVLAEATRISPHRRGSPYAAALGIASSDGICGDAAHAARDSDHNADARGIPHAVDISQSMPGAPYWDPRCGTFNAHGLGEAIAARMLAGHEPRVKYLVSHDYATGRAKILNLAVSRAWRDQDGDDHASHLHVSFTVAAEQSTAPFFLGGATSPVAPHPGAADMLVATSPVDDGYICVDEHGEVFAYGGATFHGGQGSIVLHQTVVPPGTPGAQRVNIVGPVTGVAMTRTGNGYFIANASKQLYAFGDAKKVGDPAGNPRT